MTRTKELIMKPEILQLNPILVPSINEKLDELYTVRRYYEQEDKEAYVREIGKTIRGVITGGHTGISQALMAQLPSLEIVAVNGVGTDAVDLAYARERRIPVTGTFGALTEDVADMAIGLLIAACRNISTVDRFVRQGMWPKYPQPGAIPLARRFSAMDVGIVGMGRVGRAVAIRASAFGCRIRYTDLQQIEGLPYDFVGELRQLAEQSDVLVLCAAADKAEGIINAEILNALGEGGYLVNVARGRLVKEDDLVEALQSGRIAGAGLDVFVDEPHVPKALLEMDNVVLQAHRASATMESRTAMGEMVLTSLADAFAGRRVENSLTT
jgi:hydroxypyruvate reductase